MVLQSRGHEFSEDRAVATLAAGGCSAALRALVGAGLTDSTWGGFGVLPRGSYPTPFLG